VAGGFIHLSSEKNLRIDGMYRPSSFCHSGDSLNLETGMERDEDGVVLGSTRLSGSQRLHR
jgi:hypothetical protein